MKENNGWVSTENGNMPKIKGNYWIVFKNGDIEFGYCNTQYFQLFGCFYDDAEIDYYQIVERPKPPLY